MPVPNHCISEFGPQSAMCILAWKSSSSYKTSIIVSTYLLPIPPSLPTYLPVNVYLPNASCTDNIHTCIHVYIHTYTTQNLIVMKIMWQSVESQVFRLQHSAGNDYRGIITEI